MFCLGQGSLLEFDPKVTPWGHQTPCPDQEAFSYKDFRTMPLRVGLHPEDLRVPSGTLLLGHCSMLAAGPAPSFPTLQLLQALPDPAFLSHLRPWPWLTHSVHAGPFPVLGLSLHAGIAQCWSLPGVFGEPVLSPVWSSVQRSWSLEAAHPSIPPPPFTVLSTTHLLLWPLLLLWLS